MLKLLKNHVESTEFQIGVLTEDKPVFSDLETIENFQELENDFIEKLVKLCPLVIDFVHRKHARSVKKVVSDPVATKPTTDSNKYVLILTAYQNYFLLS